MLKEEKGGFDDIHMDKSHVSKGSIEGPHTLTDYPDENAIRILISTDNHIGYNESDPIMGDDSWKTFQEIMSIGSKYKVDFFLQSGDLFHVTSPSKKSLIRVSESLTKFCWGDKPVELELLANPANSLNNPNDHLNDVNWRNPNLNISYPFFAISGNHDDSTGRDQFSAMDVLHSTGLINHFGKTMTVTDINIHPILMKKGNTKLALYGLNAIRDERLYKSFKMGKVNFNVPESFNGNNSIDQDFFNLMCVHQNHTAHTNTGFLPEVCLPNFLDLVVWGHEHECIPSIKHNFDRNFDILQPGSSVATSLCDAESKQKHAFILEISKDPEYSYKIIPIPLQTVRPFVMVDISLSDYKELEVHNKEQIQKFLLQKVDTLIDMTNKQSEYKLIEQHKHITNEDEIKKLIPLPLIRLKVDYSHPDDPDVSYMVENTRRFSNRYVGRVANPNNILQLYKKKKFNKSALKSEKSGDKKEYMKEQDIPDINKFANADEEILTIIENSLKSTHLTLLSEKGISDALRRTIINEDKNALKFFIDDQIQKNTDLMLKNNIVIESHDLKDLKSILKKVTHPGSINPDQSNNNEQEEQENDIYIQTARNQLLDTATNFGTTDSLSRLSKKRSLKESLSLGNRAKSIQTNNKKKDSPILSKEYISDENKDGEKDYILSSDGDGQEYSDSNIRDVSFNNLDDSLEDIQVSSNVEDSIQKYSSTSSKLRAPNSGYRDDPQIIESDDENNSRDVGTRAKKIPAKRTFGTASDLGKSKSSSKRIQKSTSTNEDIFKPITELSQSAKLRDILNSRRTRK